MISVKDHRELQAVVLAMKAVEKTVARDINRATVSTMGPVWKQIINSKATSRQDSAVLNKGVRVAGGNPPAAIAANSRRALSGGLRPAEAWQPFEFGSYRRKRETYYTKSKKGKSYRVTRHTQRQFPSRRPSGRVVYPAFAEFAPRLVSLWVQLVVKKIAEAAEGRSV